LGWSDEERSSWSDTLLKTDFALCKKYQPWGIGIEVELRAEVLHEYREMHWQIFWLPAKDTSTGYAYQGFHHFRREQSTRGEPAHPATPRISFGISKARSEDSLLIVRAISLEYFAAALTSELASMATA
jgi:hypothetical protein